MIFWLFGFFFMLTLFAVGLQLLYWLVLAALPLLAVGFVIWLVYRLTRR